MHSSEFETLCAQIKILKSLFLDFDKREDGIYTDEEMMNCRAFIMLSHAEFEQYLESVSLQILENEINRWKEKKEVNIVAAGVLAFRRRKDTGIPSDLNQSGKKSNLSEILLEAFNMQKNIVIGNNGIKEKNFSEIYTPLGITEVDIDETLLILLNNIGSHRGDLSHQGASKSLQTIRDPFNDEMKDIDDLILELKKFDTTIQQLYFN